MLEEEKDQSRKVVKEAIVVWVKREWCWGPRAEMTGRIEGLQKSVGNKW